MDKNISLTIDGKSEVKEKFEKAWATKRFELMPKRQSRDQKS